MNWVVSHLEDLVNTQRTKEPDADDDIGWQSGTGFCSAGIWADILLELFLSVESYCRRIPGTGRSHG